MINAIIFDVGDTITYNDWKSRLKSVEKDIGSVNWFTPTTKIARNRASTGKIKMEQALNVILKENNFPVSLSRFVASYRKNFVKYTTVNKKMVYLVKKLSKRHSLYAFSNTNNLHESITRKRGVYKLFKKSFLSHKIGFKKPDIRAFQFVLTHIKEKPSEVLFIDDNIDNIKTAQRLGMQTIVYTSYENLLKELNKIGVLT